MDYPVKCHVTYRPMCTDFIVRPIAFRVRHNNSHFNGVLTLQNTEALSKMT